MKDRVTRTNVKKPSHRLFRGMLTIASLSCLIATFLGIVLVNVSHENKALTQKIDAYTIQMEQLEKEESILLKNNK